MTTHARPVQYCSLMGFRACLVGSVVMAAASAAAAPSTPRVLTAPVIAPGPRTFVAFAGQPAAVALSWTPVPSAARYRARWTDSGAQLDVELPATATTFERAEATAGHHLLSVIALDASGRESPPTEVAIDVVAVTALAPGADTPNPTARAFAVGAQFSSPGLRCQLGDGARAEVVHATQPGAMTLHCGGEAGQPQAEVPVVIAPVVVAADVAPVRRATPTTLHLSLASVAPIGDHLQVEAIGELALGEAARSEGGLDVPVTAPPGADHVGLVVRAGTVELGRVSLALVDRPAEVAVEAPPTPQWRALDLGAQIGAFMTPQNGREASALGMPMDPDDSLASGPLAGVRLGLFPTRAVGLELEAALATPSYVGRLGVAALVISRAQVAARVVDDRRYGLRLLGGADMLSVLTNAGTSHRSTVGGVHYGAAFTVETRPRVSVRFQALHVITVAQDAGYAHCLEVTIGVVTRLGRRDRWR